MPDETGWLLEKQDKGSNWFIGVIDGMLQWTTDPNKALRLSRRDDAEAIATICDDAEKISEHLWPDMATPLVQDHGPRVDTRRIRLLHDVHGDFPFAHNVVATAGIYHPKVNPHGAVSVIASDGKLLGIKPDEFEWIEGAASQEAERGTEEKG